MGRLLKDAIFIFVLPPFSIGLSFFSRKIFALKWRKIFVVKIKTALDGHVAREVNKRSQKLQVLFCKNGGKYELVPIQY